MVRVLLEAGTLHERCVNEARRTVSLWQGVADLDGPATAMSDAAAHDLQRLSDAASHLGLAAARFGDRRLAADAWELSRRVADGGLGHDQSRIARADSSLAALAAEAGRGPHATKLITSALATRLALRERQPQDAANWRRLTVTQRTRTDIARLNGQVIEGARLAAELVADRQARLGELGQADTAEARIVLGQTLLAAGHPLAARRHLEEAADTRRARFLPTSYRVQEDLIWLAKAALVLEHPRTVLDLLDGQTAGTDWFRDRVSFRLGYTARRLLALASGGLGQTAEAVTALRAGREQLADWPLEQGLDPLAADFDRSLGELALLQGEAAGAVTSLTQLAAAEAAAGLPSPAHGWTLVLLGRAADRLGDTRRAAECLPLGHRSGQCRDRPQPSGDPHGPLRRSGTLRRARRRQPGGEAARPGARPDLALPRAARPGRSPPAAVPGPRARRAPGRRRPVHAGRDSTRRPWTSTSEGAV